jgi:tetratricopeptide (TPR) repeat protein/transcriptional regulator with XRE-family HTH domain
MVADDAERGVRATVLDGHAHQMSAMVTRRRETLGLTQAELGKRSGVSVRTIRNIELGLIARPRPDTLRRIADVLHLELNGPRPGTGGDGPTTTVSPQPAADRLDGFVGRAAELDQLDRLLAAHRRNAEGSTVGALVGAAGIGKTCLALHWAARTTARFPGGQIYVNLRGLDPTDNPMGTTEAMRTVIDHLAQASGQPPGIMTDLRARYLAMLAEKPVLLILDNARDPHQVRPLLPGAATCFVLVTSRDDLTGLVVHESAHPLIIDLPDDHEATGILRDRLGRHRLATDPQAVAQILARTGRLPLALDLVAAHAAARPGMSLSTVVDDLQGPDPLDVLTGGTGRSDLRAVFSWSYAAVPADERRAYRLMSLHPGPDASVNSAAGLLGRDVAETRRLLAALTRSHLLEERTAGRFAFHDLLRAHAMELSSAQSDRSDRAGAEHRVMEHFLHAAAIAYGLVHSDREVISPGTPGDDLNLPHFRDPQDALAWFERERASISDAIKGLARQHRDAATWQLAWFYGEYLERQGPWSEWVEVLTIALTSVRRTDNRAAEAGTLRRLGGAYAYQGELDLSLSYFRQALTRYELLGDEVGKARVHMNLAYVAERRGRPGDVLKHGKDALSGYRRAGDEHGQARALNAVGYSYALLGDHRQTLVYCGDALRMLDRLSLRRGLSPTLHSLGYAHLCLGATAEAITHFDAAIRTAREIGNRSEELLALDHLTASLELAGQHERARRTKAEAEAVRAALGRQPAPSESR